MRFQFSKIKEDHIERKSFNYSKNGVQLNFTLRTDVKTEMKYFKELLEKAIEDINKELEFDPRRLLCGGAAGGILNEKPKCQL